jgi:hypothetical protein
MKKAQILKTAKEIVLKKNKHKRAKLKYIHIWMDAKDSVARIHVDYSYSGQDYHASENIE